MDEDKQRMHIPKVRVYAVMPTWVVAGAFSIRFWSDQPSLSAL